MKTRPFIELPLLAAIWGSSFIFMKIGGSEFGPFLFMAMRTLVASLFLIPLLYIAKKQSALSGYWGKIFIVGSLNTAIPFVLFGWATLTLSAGNTAVLNGTTPMFGALVAYFWLKDTLSLSAILGICIGFLGVYFLMFDKILDENTNVLLPTIAVMVAALCYGISASYTKMYLGGISSIALAAGSQISATVLLLPISLFFLPDAIPSSPAILSVITLGILCTGIAYTIFFRLIAVIGPTKTISVTYLIPVFGITWSMIFLGETINQWTIFGAALILSGVALTTGVLKLKFLNRLVK
ncbi:DMT family transporter [Pseudocolwellia sp. HL-MZ19]|uniref:DMT family transporter n=1 Tax=unclassified Pseudocolwellia TaxID=2848178 RepID=UPI003CF51477